MVALYRRAIAEASCNGSDVDRRTTVTVICRWRRRARFLRGLIAAWSTPSEVTAIVNTGDDTELHGLTISPDLDTIVYTLAGAIDAERGWGLAGETWQAMAALERYAGSAQRDRSRARRGSGSATATWQPTCIARPGSPRAPRRPRSPPRSRPRGASASRSLPMTDDRLRDDGELAGQRRDRAVPGLLRAVATRRSRSGRSASTRTGANSTPRHGRASRRSDVVVIAPSNPLVSIGPDPSLAGRRRTARPRGASRSSPCRRSWAAHALKGPADRMMARARRRAHRRRRRPPVRADRGDARRRHGRRRRWPARSRRRGCVASSRRP